MTLEQLTALVGLVMFTIGVIGLVKINDPKARWVLAVTYCFGGLVLMCFPWL